MKKVGILIVFIMLMVSLNSAWAEIKAGSVSFAPVVGGYVFEGNQNAKDSVAVGVRAGYNFTPHWGMEGFYLYVPTKFNDTSDPDSHNNVYVGGIEGLYYFLPKGPFVPYAAIGVGAFHFSDDRRRGVPTNFAVDYGAGVKYFVDDNIAFRADVRHVLPLNDLYNDFMYTFGIDISFGGRSTTVSKEVPEPRQEEAPAPPPAPAVADTDKDGVPDSLDKCPDTPAGVAVDKDGCPIDSDKDGVANYLDKCPGTPAGEAVDKDGCPVDTDKDGVPDSLDKCPDTPAGVAVDKDGCPIDTDKDGVPDYLDKCPNTPAGATVDQNGCAREKLSIELNIEFDVNKYDVKKIHHSKIKTVADFMKAYPESKAVIVGFTDSTESRLKAKNNLWLSKARAESVRQYLIKKFGIDETRISAEGLGSKKPVASNATKEGRKKNRRVEAIIETTQLK